MASSSRRALRISLSLAAVLLAAGCTSPGARPTPTLPSTPSATASTPAAVVPATPSASSTPLQPSPTATPPAAATTSATAAPATTPEATASVTPLPAASTVTVAEGDFFLTLGAASATAGSITFNATNSGQVPHQFMVIRSDLPEDQLPVRANAVDERAVQVIGQRNDILGGDTQTLTLTLVPGRYVLICNIIGHYRTGMHASFVVR